MEEIKNSTSKLDTIKRLFKYLQPYKWKTMGIILLLLIIMFLNTLNPYLMKISIDVFVVYKDIQGLIIVGLILVGISIVSMILSRIRILSMSKIINTVLMNIRHELYSHIQTLSFTFFDNRPVGKVLSRVVGDVSALQNLLNNSIVNLIPNIFTIILVIIMMGIMNPTLTLICMVIMPFLFGAMFIIEVKANSLWRGFREKRSILLSYSHEVFSGMKVVQGFNCESYVSLKFNKKLKEHSDSFLSAIKIQDYFWPIVDLCRGLGIVIILFVGYRFTIKEEISLGTLMAFIMYIEMLWRPIMNLAAVYNAFVTNISAAQRIFEILDINNNMCIKEKKYKISKMPNIKGNIKFDNVTFSYDNDEVCALKSTSFTIKAGEKIALVGETGAGKTTITNLICRFYDPTLGKVLIDNKDVKNIHIESLRSQMGIMLQESFLFSSSIKENIRYGKLDCTDDEIIKAAKAVNAHNFIEKLEHSYDTNVNERGTRLSLGQRQLIAFARTLISNPKILILDEATANIDTETERLVQKGIKKLMEGRTSIIIAHRLSTIRDCDKIFVLSGGKIIEFGNHEELINLKGYYYNLYKTQYSFINS